MTIVSKLTLVSGVQFFNTYNHLCIYHIVCSLSRVSQYSFYHPTFALLTILITVCLWVEGEERGLEKLRQGLYLLFLPSFPLPPPQSVTNLVDHSEFSICNYECQENTTLLASRIFENCIPRQVIFLSEKVSWAPVKNSCDSSVSS